MAIAKAVVFLLLVFTLWCSTQGAHAASGSGQHCKTVKKTVGKLSETTRVTCVSARKGNHNWAKAQGPSSANISVIGQLPKMAKPLCLPRTKVCFPYIKDWGEFIISSEIDEQYVHKYSRSAYGALTFCLMYTEMVYKVCPPPPCAWCLSPCYTDGLNINGDGYALSRAQVCQGLEVASVKFVSPGVIQACNSAVTPAIKAVAPIKKQKCTPQTICSYSFPPVRAGDYDYKCKVVGAETFVGLMCYYNDAKSTYIQSCYTQVQRTPACSRAARFTKWSLVDNSKGKVGLQLTICSN